jgi:catechol 2,3-dioxygenase-like lactoylglutathione lyase family enzyme
MNPEGLGLPPVDQIGFVVEDLDKSIPVYEAVFGDYTTMDAEIEDADYRGHAASCKLKIAYFRSGPLEIELIEVAGGETVHNEFLEAGREGPHHIRFTVENFSDAAAKLESVGMKPVFAKKFSPGLEFAYFESPDGMIWEIFENSAA